MALVWIIAFIIIFISLKSKVKLKEADTGIAVQDAERDKIQMLEDNLEKIKTKYSAAQAELEEIKIKPDSAEEPIKQKEFPDTFLADFNILKRENIELKGQLDKKEKTFQDKLSQSAAVETAFKEKDEKIQTLNRESQETIEKLKKSVERIGYLEEELKSQSNLKVISKEQESKIYSLEEELEKAKAEQLSAQKEVQDIKSKPDLNKEFSKQKELDEASLAEIDRLKKENEDLIGQLDRKDKVSHEGILQSEEVNKVFKEKDERSAWLQKEIDKLKSDYIVIQNKLKEISDKPDLSHDFTEQKKLYEAQKMEFDRLKLENANLKDQLIKKEQELEEGSSQGTAAAERALRKKDNKLQNLEKENRDMLYKLNAAEANIKELKEEITVSGSQEVSKEKEGLKALVKERLKAKKGEPDFTKVKQSKVEQRLEKAAEQKKEKIGEILLKNKFITQDILDKALEHRQKFGVGITQFLLAYGYIDEEQLTQCLCTQFGFPFLPLKSYNISEEIISLVPVDIVEKYWLMPVDRREDLLTVVMADPLNTRAIKEVEQISNCRVLPFVGFFSDIIEALENYYHVTVAEKSGSKSKRTTTFFIDTESYKGIERRQARRFKVEFASYFPIEGQYKKAKIIDVSRTGFLIETERALPINSTFILQIDTPKECSLLPVMAFVKVARVTSLENNKFGMGVHITKIAKEDINLMLKYAVSENK